MLGCSDAQMLGRTDALILLQLMLMLPASVESDASTSAKSVWSCYSTLSFITAAGNFDNFATAVEE